MSFKSVVCFALAVTAAAPTVQAAEMKATEMKAVGTFAGGIVQQLAQPLGAPDHLVVSALAKGTHKSPGSPLDGAAFQLSETFTIDKGNGPQNGEITFVNDKGSVTNELHGTVKTAMVDGQMRTTVSGTYRMVAGTGLFGGANGHGTYSVAFTSPTDFMGGYTGTLTIPKLEAAR